MKHLPRLSALPRWMTVLFDRVLLLLVLVFLLTGLWACLRLFWSNATAQTLADPEVTDMPTLLQE